MFIHPKDDISNMTQQDWLNGNQIKIWTSSQLHHMPLGSAKATVALWVHSCNECIVPYYSMYIYTMCLWIEYIYIYLYTYYNICIYIYSMQQQKHLHKFTSTCPFHNNHSANAPQFAKPSSSTTMQGQRAIPSGRPWGVTKGTNHGI